MNFIIYLFTVGVSGLVFLAVFVIVLVVVHCGVPPIFIGSFVARAFLVEVVFATTHWDSARKALLLVVLCVCVYVSKVVPVRLDFILATHRAAFVTYVKSLDT